MNTILKMREIRVILFKAGVILFIGMGAAFVYNTFSNAGIPLQLSASSGQYTIDTRGYPVLGAEGAPVTIVTFSDFQCPYSLQAMPMLNQALVRYSGKVRVVFRNFPLPKHEEAQKAHEAAACAEEQGKFWVYHDRLFANQNAQDIQSLKKYASDLRLNVEQFKRCLDTGKFADKIQKEIEEAKQYGVTGTPSFFINGISRDIQSFEQLAWYITDGKDGKLKPVDVNVTSTNMCR